MYNIFRLLLLVLLAVTANACTQHRPIIAHHERLSLINDNAQVYVRKIGDGGPFITHVLSVTPEDPSICASSPPSDNCSHIFPSDYSSASDATPHPFSTSLAQWEHAANDPDWQSIVLVESPEPAFGWWVGGGAAVVGVAALIPSLYFAASSNSNPHGIEELADGALVFGTTTVSALLGSLIGWAIYESTFTPSLSLATPPGPR